MSAINQIFGVPLGYIMHLCYRLLENYGLAIILFTLITKIIMFPLSLVSQKNSIVMVKIRPRLDDIRRRYAGRNSEIAEQQRALYKKERYSPLKGMLPLLVQIPIILGLINVIYNPLQHILRLAIADIQPLLEKTAALLNTTVGQLGTGAELRVLEAVQSNPGAFAGMTGVEAITAMDVNFLGFDLAAIPTLLSYTVLVPILSGLSALVLALYQNRHNILQRAQGAMSRWGMTIFLVIFSAFFAYILPMGVGLYWIVGNLLSIPVLWLCNKIYDPGAYADTLALQQKPKLSKEEKRAERALNKRKRETQKRDKKRFREVKDKRLVFYSESSGFYKYFQGFIDFILANSDETIHYVTSDIDDQVFSMDHPRFETYYIGPLALIRFMMLMDADMVVMTLPDLEKYHIKRSLVRKDIEYVYLDHGMTSFHLMLQEGALDHFDTIFCYGPNHVREVRETEAVYDLPRKRLVKTGFPLLDSMLEGAASIADVVNDPKVILIAPSWQQDNILEYCLDETLTPLLGAGYRVVVRPHPEFVKRFPHKMQAIIDKYQGQVGDLFEIQTSFASNETVYSADLVITDWSSIANEFSYATKKPSLFINTPMKVVNPNYEKIESVPLDISLRDEIGVSVDVDQLPTLLSVVNELFAKKAWYKTHLEAVVRQNIYDVGDGARGGGEYIIAQLEKRRQEALADEEGVDDKITDDQWGEEEAESPLTLKEEIDLALNRLSGTPLKWSVSLTESLEEPLQSESGETKSKGRWLLEYLDRLSEEDGGDADEA
ncbi:MAG TPA: membrane protein insertase YidC [Fastidiosipila sp.]|nr:membrane protein insertase YidC [Fastidiosipila sp.]